MLAHSLSRQSTINRSSAGTVFIRQNLTYKDSAHNERIKIFIMAVIHNIGIQMKQTDLT